MLSSTLDFLGQNIRQMFLKHPLWKASLGVLVEAQFALHSCLMSKSRSSNWEMRSPLDVPGFI